MQNFMGRLKNIFYESNLWTSMGSFIRPCDAILNLENYEISSIWIKSLYYQDSLHTRIQQKFKIYSSI